MYYLCNGNQHLFYTERSTAPYNNQSLKSSHSLVLKTHFSVSFRKHLDSSFSSYKEVVADLKHFYALS